MGVRIVGVLYVGGWRTSGLDWRESIKLWLKRTGLSLLVC